MNESSKAAEQQKKKIELVDDVDATIKTICGSIRTETTLSDEYAEIVKALAILVEARAKLLSY